MNLAPGDSAVDSFSLWVAQPLGLFQVGCTLALAGDTVPQNNRLLDTVVVVWRDVACSRLVAPVGEFDSGSVVTPRAWVSNRGSIGVTFDCRFAIGGFYADTQRLTIGPGDSVLVGFDSLALQARGTWAVVCSTMLDRDQSDSNDVQRDSVTVHVTDAALLAIEAPTDSVDSGVPVQPRLRLRNAGSRPADFVAWLQMGQGADSALYRESVNVTLGPAAESVVAFDSLFRPARLGQWRVAGWLVLARDQHPENDSLRRAMYVRPPGGISWPPGWNEVSSLPSGGGKDVKGGGALATLTWGSPPARIYATKGNKTSEFYSYHILRDSWATLTPVPPGREAKPPDKGCRIVGDGGSVIYLVKGGNTLGFFRYSLADSGWTQLEDVPLGTTGKKVKGGTDIVFVPSGTDREARSRGIKESRSQGVEESRSRGIEQSRTDSGLDPLSPGILEPSPGYVYLLKGYKNEFHRFNTTTGHWETMQPAPGAIVKWDKGSFLVYDDEHTIYAHKSKYNELWRYDTDSARWGAQLTGMPLYNSAGKKKKSKDGAAGAWYDGSIYALKGGNTQEFWCYFAGRDSWAERETLPLVGGSQRKKKVKDGGDLVFNAYAFWALKGNKTREFWRYGLALDAEARANGEWRVANRESRVADGQGRMALMSLPLAGSPILVYTGTEATTITARVYDAAGRLVAIPLTRCEISGPGSVRLSTGKLASGVYLLQVTAGDEVRSYKLVVR
jgi:hypothetical protein